MQVARLWKRNQGSTWSEAKCTQLCYLLEWPEEIKMIKPDLQISICEMHMPHVVLIYFAVWMQPNLWNMVRNCMGNIYISITNKDTLSVTSSHATLTKLNTHIKSDSHSRPYLPLPTPHHHTNPHKLPFVILLRVSPILLTFQFHLPSKLPWNWWPEKWPWILHTCIRLPGICELVES